MINVRTPALPFLVFVVVLATWMSFMLPPEFQQIKPFKLKDANNHGQVFNLKDQKDIKGLIVIFTCNHCPFAQLYPERLNALHTKFAPLGVPIVAISSMDTITYDEDGWHQMVAKAQKDKLAFPYLYDGSQKVAKNFKAQKTPHAYVLWRDGRHFYVRYSGAIDDNGMEPQNVTKSYVKETVEALLNNKPVEVTETKSIGCQIYFRGQKEMQ